MKPSVLSISLTALLLCSLSACDNGVRDRVDFDPTPPPEEEPPEEPPEEEPPTNGDGDGVADPSATPLKTTVTLMGGSYAADGTARVLVHDADNDQFVGENQERDGLTLYTFDQDPVNESACNSQECVEAWPPLLTTEDSVIEPPLSSVSRDDGSTQWALRGKPLYFFMNDEVPGDINGQGVNDVWRVAVTEPVILSAEQSNTDEGRYFIAQGEVSIAVPETEGSTDSFVAETQNKDGFTLYTFAMDPAGESVCTGDCLANWPALLATENAVAETPFSLIERDMGTAGTATQWAYHDKPLYFFANDTVAGDVNGAAIENWLLARPMPWLVQDTEHGSAFGGAGLLLQATPGDTGEQTEAVPAHGMSLYTFDNDEPGVSNCTGDCLQSWPALIAHEGAEASGPFSLVERASGEQQWALQQMPLYFFSNDAGPGEVAGDDVNDVWHLARTPPVDVDAHPDEGDLFVGSGELVDANGDPDDQFQEFTLYTFAEDTENNSNCFDACIGVWPPLYAPADAEPFGDFDVIERDDQGFHWTYQGDPLYFYTGDSMPGDVNGEITDSFGTWFIARP